MTQGFLMTNPTSELDFLREGLVRYADAKETVSRFQSAVQDALLGALTSQTWRNFRPNLTNDAFESNKAMGSIFIHAYIAGTVPSREATEKVWVSLGLYWHPPLYQAASVVAACHVWLDKTWVWVPFNPVPPQSKVIAGALYKKGERRLFLPLAKDFTPDTSFSALLEVVDAALGPP